MTAKLSTDRLENALPDKKPLYTSAEAKAEADRCLYCSDAPCIKACPTEIDIPTFIKKIASGNVRGSAKTIFEQNLLGYSCARVCPVEVLCQGDCVYTGWGRDPINIGRLQRFATETATAQKTPLLARGTATVKKKVACIGGGPASLSFAGYLALEGHDAVIFEKRAHAGGLNTTGIAPYKLHAHDALHEVDFVKSFGVDVQTGVEVGSDDGPGKISAKKLLETYDAVFIGIGLGADTKLSVPGEDGPGVYGATEWIEKMKLELTTGHRDEIAGKRVIVVGGGNTAIDVARETALLGAADVAMAYRRGVPEMSGYAHEMAGGRKEGVRLVGHVQPIGYERDASGKLTGLKVATTDKDAKPIAGSEHVLPCDLVFLAIGQSKLRDMAKELGGVELDKRGCVVVADPKTCQTGNPKVFAGGDCINGGKEVVNAVADGRNAARTLLERWAQK
ncbi:MAG: FAD-dependent oxidoreductase [Labilithrix sp.]